MHTPLREQHEWLARVLHGHYAYYGVTGNSCGLRRFLTQAVKAWHGAIWRGESDECRGTARQPGRVCLEDGRDHRRKTHLK